MTNAKGQVTQIVYDSNTGKSISFTDPNLRTTTFFYADSLDRMTGGQMPDGGSTSIAYCDEGAATACASSKVTVTKVQNSCGAPSQKVITDGFYDKLGRTYRLQQFEGTSSIFIDTVFDGLGRVKQVSQPYRVSPALNTTNYDALGRTISTFAPDGSQTLWGYISQGPDFIETDPAGAERKQVFDAYGRLTQITEDPNGSSLTTLYRYDVLDNLVGVCVGVCQGGTFNSGSGICEGGGLARQFQYDSLKRLTAANNPETGIVSTRFS